MLFDFIEINKKIKTPIYQQIYDNIKKAVESGSLKKGSRLPSIRKLSNDLEISKTTVESAYNQLCVEGYIKNIPQKGYFVEAELNLLKTNNSTVDYNKSNKPEKIYLYDFGSRKIEYSSGLTDWKKEVKNILNKEYLLKFYGEQQGEYILRTALEKYSFTVRGVNSTAENIVIGAGTQSLLYILCGLVGVKKIVALEKGSFIQAEQIFRDFNYSVSYYTSDDEGIDIKSLEKIKPDVVLLNPNFNVRNGMNTSINRRIELINWCKSNNCLIFEDDYNGELRYNTRPVHCIQSYDTDNTVYIGSFSKLLLPAVRIGYMVLPPKLYEMYKKRALNYNQTSSKTEQLALSEYINHGLLEKHLRKLRRLYSEKSKTMLEQLKKIFGNEITFVFNETALSILVKHKQKINKETLYDECEKNQIKINKSRGEEFDYILSFSGISKEQIPQALKALKKITDNAKER